MEDLFYGWEHFEERELFDELAKRCKAYLAAYDAWVKQFRAKSRHPQKSGSDESGTVSLL